jgi:hypothetical protein
MFHTVIGTQVKQWLATTSQVLHERPERLQKLVLHISKKNPDLGFYAADLASLRMSGLEFDNILAGIWNADSVRRIDEIIRRQPADGHPAAQAIEFMAALIKADLTRGYRLQQTFH